MPYYMHTKDSDCTRCVTISYPLAVIDAEMFDHGVSLRTLGIRLWLNCLLNYTNITTIVILPNMIIEICSCMVFSLESKGR